MIRSRPESQLPEIVFASDASGKWGCGASWQESWLQLPWTAPVSIAAKELILIVLACAVWGEQWQGKHVLVWCDNMAVVQVIAGLSSRDSLLMHLLRLLYFFLAIYSIQLEAKHIPILLQMPYLALVFPAPTSSTSYPNANPQSAQGLVRIEARGLAIVHLAEGLINDSLAPSSRKAYSSAQAT